MVSFTLGILLTLNTSIGWGMGSKESFYCHVKDFSLTSPPAPESIRALVLMVQSSQVIETGIHIDCLDTCVTITGETVILGQRDVDAADHFKNPSTQQA